MPPLLAPEPLSIAGKREEREAEKWGIGRLLADAVAGLPLPFESASRAGDGGATLATELEAALKSGGEGVPGEPAREGIKNPLSLEADKTG